jgi:hypothetical protein
MCNCPSIVPKQPLSLSTTCACSLLEEITMILPGFTGSSAVSVSIEPNVSRSTISLSSVYRLQLLPLFDRYGRYLCEVPVCVPTRGGFYTSKIPLECSCATRDADIILGSDWISTCLVGFRDDGQGLEDPTQLAMSSLPASHYWSPNGGTTITYQLYLRLTRNFRRHGKPSR